MRILRILLCVLALAWLTAIIYFEVTAAQQLPVELRFFVKRAALHAAP